MKEQEFTVRLPFTAALARFCTEDGRLDKAKARKEGWKVGSGAYPTLSKDFATRTEAEKARRGTRS